MGSPQSFAEFAAEPAPELTRTAEPAPPPEFEMDYHKTRVERVLRRRVDAGPLGVVVQNTLTERTMMGGRGLDPKWGTLFIRVDATGQGSTAQVKVYWEVPGGASGSLRSTTTLTLGEVNEVALWAGPLAGPVRWDLELKGGGSVQRFRVVADVVAKRRCARFDPGMLLSVADPLIAPARAGAFDPDFDREVEPRQGCRPARAVPSAARRQGPEPVEQPSFDVDAPSFCGEPPEDSLADWGPQPCPGADPEVGAYVKDTLSGTLSATSLTLNALGLAFTFPDDFPSLAGRVGTPLVDYVGRYEGFADRWGDVSQGLDADRMTPANLRILLSTFGGIPETSGWSSIDGMVDGGFDVLSPNWAWKGTAIWLDPKRFPTWFMVSLLNLLRQTTDGLKQEIATPTTKDRFLRKKKKKVNRIRANQAAWRLDGVGASYLNLYPGLLKRALAGYQGNFSVQSMSWTGFPVFDPVYTTWFGNLWPGYRKANAVTVPLPRPIPSTVTLHPHIWLPYADAARRLYSLSRLLTMCALRVAKDGGGRAEVGRLTTAAKLVYRAYLGCLAIPGKTLVHEVFHTIPGAFPGSDLALAAGANAALSGMGAAGLLATAAVDLVAFFARLKKTSHCKTGCGQEKMSAWWFAKVLARTAFLPVSISPASTSSAYPSPFALRRPSAVTMSDPILFSSGCGKRPSAVFAGTAIVKWPDEPGRSVPMFWYRFDTVRFPGVVLSPTLPTGPLGTMVAASRPRVAQPPLPEFQSRCADDAGVVRVVRP